MSPQPTLPGDGEAQRRTSQAPPSDLESASARVVRLAARALAVGTAALTLLDGESPRTVAVHRLPAGATLDTELATLASAALRNQDVYEATDLDHEPWRGASREGPAMCWYAAASLPSASGRPVGLLEVIGWAPRPPLDAADRQTLVDLAAVAGELLEAHAARADVEAVRRELERRSDHDPLTGALTRRGLVDRLEGALALVRRTERTLTVVLLERPGLATLGDRAYVEIVGRLRAGVRDHDLVARWGEDAFVVVLQAGDGVSQAMVARRLARDVGRSVAGETEDAKTLVSVGVATYPDAGEDALGLLSAAATALVGAKLRGGGVAEAPGLTESSGAG